MTFWHIFTPKHEYEDGQRLRAKADELTIAVDKRIARRQKVKRENHLGENVKRAMGG